MVSVQEKILISPVNMDERKTLGIRAGDTVGVRIKIQEKGKTRLQMFEGLVLAVKHGGEAGGTFTVRKVTSGVGVEKIFPLYSPAIDSIKIVRRSKVRRSKLYFIREKVSREIKRQMRNMRLMSVSTGDEPEDANNTSDSDHADETTTVAPEVKDTKKEANTDTAPDTVTETAGPNT